VGNVAKVFAEAAPSYTASLVRSSLFSCLRRTVSCSISAWRVRLPTRLKLESKRQSRFCLLHRAHRWLSSEYSHRSYGTGQRWPRGCRRLKTRSIRGTAATAAPLNAGQLTHLLLSTLVAGPLRAGSVPLGVVPLIVARRGPDVSRAAMLAAVLWTGRGRVRADGYLVVHCIPTSARLS